MRAIDDKPTGPHAFVHSLSKFRGGDGALLRQPDGISLAGRPAAASCQGVRLAGEHRQVLALRVHGVRRLTVDDVSALPQGAGNLVDVLAIHDTYLWRDMGYATWESFIAGEVKLSRRHANRQLSHQRFLALLPGPSAPVHASARDPTTSEADTNGTQGPTPTERQTREIRSDPAAVARVRRMVAQGKTPREAVEAVNDSVDFGPRTVNAGCAHLYRCAKCGAER